MYSWWDKFFKREEAIDIRHLKGRRAAKHQDVWKQAHEMFKNKVKNQGKIPIPVPIENEDMQVEDENMKNAESAI